MSSSTTFSSQCFLFFFSIEKATRMIFNHSCGFFNTEKATRRILSCGFLKNIISQK